MKDPLYQCSAEGLGPSKSLAHRKALLQKNIANRTTMHHRGVLYYRKIWPTEMPCSIEGPDI